MPLHPEQNPATLAEFEPVDRVYIHVPWCRTRCPYCAFALQTAPHNRPRTGFDTHIAAELQAWQNPDSRSRLSRILPLKSLYLGGGTPSLLPATALQRILALFEYRDDAEVTLEANPEDISRPNIDAWKAAGINRISLGVQSFVPHVAKALGRWRSFSHLDAALELIARHFDNWSLDLVYGHASESERDWILSLTRTVRWRPPHVSMYALSVEEHTPFALRQSRGFDVCHDDDRLTDRWQQAVEFLAGWELYEVSNLARPGYEAQHNAAYWQDATWLGLGAGASGTLQGHGGRYRYTNAHPSGNRQGEYLSREQHALEQLALGLRCRYGVSLSLFARTAHMDRLLQDHLGYVSNAMFYLYPGQWYRADGYADFLLEDLITEQEPVPA